MIVEAAMVFLATAYCTGAKGCGASNERTKSGTRPVTGVTAACDPGTLPRHSTFAVIGRGENRPASDLLRTSRRAAPGSPSEYLSAVQGKRWICEDIGPMVNGRHVDLFVGRGPAALKRAKHFDNPRLRVRVLSRPGVPSNLPPWNERHSE